MHRFFVTTDGIQDNFITLDQEQSHHILKVLRLKPGDYLQLFDGVGNEYLCWIHSRKDGGVLVEIESHEYFPNEPATRVILAQGLAKGEKMDFVIQKAVEIGVFAIIPFVSERTIVAFDTKKAEHKKERWQNIAREACKQSRRNVIPKIKPIIQLQQLLDDIKEKRAVMLYENAEKLDLRDILTDYQDSLHEQSITVIVGPEGGFAPAEVQMAQNNNVSIAGLGPRILRTETAGLVAASIILYEGGDLG